MRRPISTGIRRSRLGKKERNSVRGPYRIHTVSEMTDVPEPTLRAWERRYGIPLPQRTASGYRLYGEREVEEVRLMRRMCEEGMAPAEAARLIQNKRTPANDVENKEETAYGAAARSLVEAVQRFDDAAIVQEMRKIFYLGHPVAVLDEVLTPALRQIGDLWHRGEIDVAQEHLASQHIGTAMRDLLRLTPADEAQPVVLACFADEIHELGLLGLAIRLAHWKLYPVLLGARTPPDALQSAVESVSPVLVGLSVTIRPDKARARELASGYARACGDVPWIVGGAASAGIEDVIVAQGGLVASEDPNAQRMLIREALERHRKRPKARKR